MIMRFKMKGNYLWCGRDGSKYTNSQLFSLWSQRMFYVLGSERSDSLGTVHFILLHCILLHSLLCWVRRNEAKEALLPRNGCVPICITHNGFLWGYWGLDSLCLTLPCTRSLLYNLMNVVPFLWGWNDAEGLGFLESYHHERTFLHFPRYPHPTLAKSVGDEGIVLELRILAVPQMLFSEFEKSTPLLVFGTAPCIFLGVRHRHTVLDSCHPVSIDFSKLLFHLMFFQWQRNSQTR